MNIQERIKGLLLRASLLVAFLFAVTVFINLPWFDEPLHPDLVSLSSPSPVSMDDNSFPLIHAFGAANDKNQLTVGQTMIRTMRDRYQQGEKPALSREEVVDLLGGTDLDEEWQSNVQNLFCNSRLTIDCAGQLIAQIDQLDFDQPRIRTLLERYDEIIQAPRFQENEEIDAITQLPSYGLLMHVSRMRLAISYQTDTIEQILTKVEGDIHFWRLMLRDGQTLIAKMVALAGFRDDLEFLSALIRLRDLDDSALQSIRNLLQPLTREELDMGESFRAELRISLLSDNSLVALMSSKPSWTARLFLQDRATLNEYYLKTVMPLRLRASLTAKDFYDQQGFDRLAYDFRVFPPPLFNLGGKLALKQISSEHLPQDYISRMHDVNGRVALVLLQIEIEESPKLGIENILRTSTFRNPYTGEAMRYDTSANTIGFECLTENPGDVCSVSIGAGDR